MADVEKCNRIAVLAIMDTLKAEEFLKPMCFRLCTKPLSADGSRTFDVWLLLPWGVKVLIVCIGSEVHVEISPPKSIGFLFEDEFKPMLSKENRVYMGKSLEMKLRSDVIIQSWVERGEDSIFLNFFGSNNRLDVILKGSTCIPRLKLLLERLCCGLLDSLAATELAPS